MTKDPTDFRFLERGTVEAAMSGDDDAMRRLWQAHRRWTAAILLAHKPRGVEVEDLLQDVAMTVVRRVAELRDPASFRPWLRAIAVNAARAAARSRRSRPHSDATPDLEGVLPPDTDVDRAGPAEEARRVMAAVAQLPAAYREPLVLRAVRGLSYRHIAATLEMTETTVQTRIARARRMLRETLETSNAAPAEARLSRGASS